MPEDKLKYVFFGRIMPERATLNVSDSLVSFIDFQEYKRNKIITDVNHSQLISRIFLPKSGQPYSLESVRTTIQYSVEQFTDLLTYLRGHAYYIDIISALKPSGESVTFGTSIPVSTPQNGQNLKERFESVINLLYTDKDTAEYLQLCMADLRASILIPRDTGFFCYRAIETLKNAISENEKGGEAWKSFRNKTGISRKNIELVKKYADSRRHGKPQSIDTVERTQVLRETWRMVDTSLNFLLQRAKDGHDNE